MEGSVANADAGREIDRLVVQPVLGGEGGVGLGAVRAEHGIAGDHGPEHHLDGLGAEVGQHGIDRVAGAVAGDQGRDLLGREAPLARPLAAPVRPRPGAAAPRRHRREPLWERRKKVSSASTTPASASRAAVGARRKRCRQRKLVVRCTPQWAAALASVMPAASASP